MDRVERQIRRGTELVRLSAIRVYQSAGEDGVPTGPIHLRRVGDGDRAWRGRVADVM